MPPATTFPATPLPDLQPTAVLPRKWTPRVGILVALLPLGIGLGVVGGLLILQRPDELPTALGLALLGAALLGLSAWRWWRETTRRVALFPSGLSIHQGHQVQALRYAEVEEVWLQAQRIQAGGLLGMAARAASDRLRRDAPLDRRGLLLQVKVVGAGSTLKLNHYDRGVFAAYQEILTQVNPRLVAEALQRLNADQPLNFGKVTLDRHRISFGRTTLPLAELTRIGLEQGMFTVKCTGKWFAKSQPISRIPNVFVLMELLRLLMAGRIPVEAPMGMNLVAKGICI